MGLGGGVMRGFVSRARASLRTSGRWQGVAGAGLVTGGVFDLAGPGFAAVVAGLFLLVGAWGSR
jgi:hypothetical protein